MADLVCWFKCRTMSSRTLWEIGRSPLDQERKCHKTKISELGHDEENLYIHSNKRQLVLDTSWIEGEALLNVTERDVVSLEEQKKYQKAFDWLKPLRGCQICIKCRTCVGKGVDGANTCHGPLLHPIPEWKKIYIYFLFLKLPEQEFRSSQYCELVSFLTSW